MVKSNRILFDRLTWARWLRAAGSFVGSPDAGRRAKVLTAALLGLLLAINGLNVVNSYVGRDFMTAIEQREHAALRRDGAALRRRLRGLHASRRSSTASPRSASGCSGASGSRAARARPTSASATYYRLREQSEIGNPDQRIADDVRVVHHHDALVRADAAERRRSRSSRSRACCGRSARCCSASRVAYAALGSLPDDAARPAAGLAQLRPGRPRGRASAPSSSTCARTPSRWRCCAARAGIGARLLRRVDELDRERAAHHRA